MAAVPTRVPGGTVAGSSNHGGLVTRRQARRAAGRVALLLLTVASTRCATYPPLADMPALPARERTASLTLLDTPFEMHLSTPQGRARAEILVIYASGDGGWFGSAASMFRRIGSAGYDAAGFSSRAFLKIARPHHARLTVDELEAEYRQIVDEAGRQLDLTPTAPVILAGWSRGAAFSVLAASAWSSSRPLQGVIAVGLSEGEDLVSNGSADETDDGMPPPARDRWPFEPYVEMAGLGPLRCAVIQGTQDQYLSAAGARALLGPDSASRRLYVVTARNHRFSGGEAAFSRALLEAVDWVAAGPRITVPQAPAPREPW